MQSSMQTNEPRQRIKRELTAPQITVGGRIISPIVSVDGVTGRGASPERTYEYGWVRLTPTTAYVSDGYGRETTVTITDVHEKIERGMALGGIAVATAALVAIVTRRMAR